MRYQAKKRLVVAAMIVLVVATVLVLFAAFGPGHSSLLDGTNTDPVPAGNGKTPELPGQLK